MATAKDSPASWLRTHGRPALRIGAAALLFGPGVSKFITYDRSVDFFTTLGLPAPELLVLVVGGIEIGAALSLFFDRVPWLGALLAIPMMAVAIATAGPSWQNIGVLLASTLVIGTNARVRAIVG
jgi:putative oxidoreductase